MQEDLKAAVEQRDRLLVRSAKGWRKRSVGAEDRSAGFAVAGGLKELGEF